MGTRRVEPLRHASAAAAPRHPAHRGPRRERAPTPRRAPCRRPERRRRPCKPHCLRWAHPGTLPRQWQARYTFGQATAPVPRATAAGATRETRPPPAFHPAARHREGFPPAAGRHKRATAALRRPTHPPRSSRTRRIRRSHQAWVRAPEVARRPAPANLLRQRHPTVLPARPHLPARLPAPSPSLSRDRPRRPTRQPRAAATCACEHVEMRESWTQREA